MVAMVTVVDGLTCEVVLLEVQGKRADVQGEVENADEGRKRHAVEAVSVYECVGVYM
jgi:hypothetical protein